MLSSSCEAALAGAPGEELGELAGAAQEDPAEAGDRGDPVEGPERVLDGGRQDQPARGDEEAGDRDEVAERGVDRVDDDVVDQGAGARGEAA
jgi:hypothetical protein